MRIAILLFLLIVLVPMPATTAQTEPAFIFHNGTVLTINDTNDIAEAILIRGNTIEAIGSDVDILAMQDSSTTVIDLGGLTVMPGFIDGHTHVLRRRPADMSLADVQTAVLSYGITTVNELSADQGYIDELLAAEQIDEIRLRVNVFPEYNDFQLENGQTVLHQVWYQDNEPILDRWRRVRIPGVKIFVDGVFYEGRGCMALTEPFAVDVEGVCFSELGDAYFTQQELNDAVQDIQGRGYRVAMHAFGDRAVDMGLNAIQLALRGASNEDFRHQLHHNSAIREDQMVRYADLGILASLRGYFNTCDWDIYAESYGADRGVLAVNRFGLPLEGVHTFMEGDFTWNTNPADKSATPYLNPMLALYGMVTHQQFAEDGSTCLPPADLTQYAIGIEQALQIATINGAYAVSMEDVTGSLEVGKYADLVILSDNPLQTDSQRLHDIQALMTMVDGRVEFCRSGFDRLCGTAPEENVLFYEDFSDNATDWDTIDIDISYSRIIGDKYVIVFTADEYNGWVVQPGSSDWSKAPIFTEPYEVSVEVSNVATTSGDYCLLMDFDARETSVAFRRFRICSNDNWAFYDFQNESLTTIAEGTAPTDIDLLDAATHVLSVSVTNTDYTFSIDGNVIATTASIGPIDGSVRFGLIRSNQEYTVLKAEFDNLMVRSIE